MTALQGYAVLKVTDPDDPEPYCIVRIDVDTGAMHQGTVEHTIVAAHSSINLARYWATMLNEGKETEESCRQKITESKDADAPIRRG